MSQAGMNDNSVGPVPPTVPESFVTDVNSPAVPAANVLNLVGGDVSTSDDDGIQTDGSSASNTLTVQLTNRVLGTGQTVGAVTADIITFPLAATPAAYKFFVETVGRSTANFATGAQENAVIRTDGATATIVANVDFNGFNESPLVPVLFYTVVSGNNVIVRVGGSPGHTINWKSLLTYIQVS